MADFDTSLSSWRQVYGASERHPTHAAEENGDAAFLRSKQARLASLCLTSVEVHALFVADLKAFVTKEGRQQDPELQQLVEDYGTYALGMYTQHSAKALRMAIERVIDDRPAVIVRTVTPPVHRQQSLTERLFGR